MKYTSKPKTFEQWQEFARWINARAKSLQDSRHDQGWAMAATVGIPRNGCALHNASIDDDLKGWCFKNPDRLRVARQANHIVNDWAVSDLARGITGRAWNFLAKSKGWAHS